MSGRMRNIVCICVSDTKLAGPFRKTRRNAVVVVACRGLNVASVPDVSGGLGGVVWRNLSVLSKITTKRFKKQHSPLRSQCDKIFVASSHERLRTACWISALNEIYQNRFPPQIVSQRTPSY